MKHSLGLPLILALVIASASCSRRPETAPSAPPPQVDVAGETQYPLTIADDLGVKVTVPRRPERIVSLAPNTTEILFALGVGDRIVGVSQYSNYPPEARKIAQVGAYDNFSQEMVVSLKPDIVFGAHGNTADAVLALRSLSIPVFGVNPKSYADVIHTIEKLGSICGVPRVAGDIGAQMYAAQANVEAKTQSLPPERRPLTLVTVYLDPLVVAGPGSFPDDMLRVCGARNAAAKVGKPWVQMSMEVVLAADPELIVVTSSAEKPRTAADALKELRAKSEWRNVKAVRNGRVVVVDNDPLTIPGPRLAEGLRQLAAGVHPELFPPSVPAATSEATHGR
jgi:iron complex transport system substrate-binding protein